MVQIEKEMQIWEAHMRKAKDKGAKKPKTRCWRLIDGEEEPWAARSISFIFAVMRSLLGHMLKPTCSAIIHIIQFFTGKNVAWTIKYIFIYSTSGKSIWIITKGKNACNSFMLYVVLCRLKHLANFEGFFVISHAHKSTSFACVAWKRGQRMNNQDLLKQHIRDSKGTSLQSYLYRIFHSDSSTSQRLREPLSKTSLSRRRHSGLTGEGGKSQRHS